MSEYSNDEEEKSPRNYDDQSIDDMQFSDKNQIDDRLETQNDEFSLNAEQQNMASGTELVNQRAMSEKTLGGYNSTRFSQMVEDLLQKYRIPHYGIMTSNTRFEVIQPALINNKYVTYHINGEDSLGQFDGKRRYNEFYQLRNILCVRWPGVFVPAIPPKKAVGNKDVKFIIERRYYLERFLKQISLQQNLLNSEEFRIFARPEFTGGNSDVQSQLLKLPKINYDEMGAKYIESFGLNEVQFKRIADRQQDYETKLLEFENFLRKLLLQYKALRKQLKGLAEIQDQAVQNQRDSTNDLYKSLRDMCEKTRNPFTSLYYWVKGEILDCNAFQEAIHQRSQLTLLIQKMSAKKLSQQNELDKLLGGKKSIRTFFKSSNEKQNYSITLQKQIDQTDKQIEGLISMGIVLDWHLGDFMMPTFKKDKIDNFSHILREMSSTEVENSNVGAMHWSKVLSNQNLKHF
ncbi:UNKNOWN [Stylonychia lemnae]|uniref:PX domain-containing protein n=1 Tax=Stylonychia lemnae TaxID=5949 RepID=A0A078ATS5_STYLE|nr:UNKNOWN [Stylonychia lemnae]|eukprot:CDW84248.1 UNKNOWN [Stylonychia lemnae]